MTQIRAFAKRLKIDMAGVEVKARLHWKGEQVGAEPYVTAPVSFSLDVDIDSEATADELRALLESAKKGCFIEQSLAEGVIVGHRIKLNNEWHDV